MPQQVGGYMETEENQSPLQKIRLTKARSKIITKHFSGRQNIATGRQVINSVKCLANLSAWTLLRIGFIKKGCSVPGMGTTSAVSAVYRLKAVMNV